jgi:lysophospholipase L1-like esterase
MNKITVWGDSVLKGVVLDDASGKYMTLEEQGCVPSVARDLSIPIDNRSRFGMTSEKGKAYIAKCLADGCDSDVAVVCFGGNDVDHHWREIAEEPDKPHQPRVPLDSFVKNLADIVGMLKERGIAPILVTLPPIDAARYFAWFSKGIEKSGNILKWLGDVGHIYRMHELYDLAVVKTARELGCRLIDIRQSFLEAQDFLGRLCTDGIHPNRSGHLLMEQEFVQYAKESGTL